MEEMFDILRASMLTGEDLSISDWEPLFEEMQQQAVDALPGVWLKTHLKAEPWILFCLLNHGQWVQLMHAQDQLLQLLEANNIPCVILKGAAAAMAYPHPTLRSMGDVDLLVKRCDLERTAALFEHNGYRLTNEKDADSHHYRYAKDMIPFEMDRMINRS